MESNREINLFNPYHFGDHIFNVHFLNKYKKYNIKFNYYIYSGYFKEIENFIDNKNIQLFPLEHSHTVPADAYNLWIGYKDFFYKEISNFNYMFDLFYVYYYKQTCTLLNLDCVIKNNFDLLFDNKSLINLNKTYDYLIINSLPMSNQYNYKEEEFIDLCNFLVKNNKTFITTKKLQDYECTLDYNMSLVDIGNLSNSCNNIIAVNTSPVIPTFTIQNITKINKRFILDNKKLTYSYNDRIYNLTNLSDIYNLL
jgi:hypothetical protein